MNSPFLYNRPLQAPEVLGRTAGADWLASNLLKGQHSVVWDTPKTGKSSFINKVLAQIRKNEQAPLICRLSCFNIRSEHSLYAALANALFGCVANTLGEWENLAATLLPVSKPGIPVPNHQGHEFYLVFADDLSVEAYLELARFPQAFSTHLNRRVIMVLESFHTLVEFSGAHARSQFQKIAELWKSMPDVTWLICGSGSTASSGYSVFRELFDERRPFYRFAEHVPLEPIDEKEFTDYIIRSFAKAGRVISRDYAGMICLKMEGHPYYVQYLADICFSNTKGYMNDAMFQGGLEELLDIFQQPFESICQELTTPQIYFLRAISQGVEQFCSIEVMDKYFLKSSGNVSRIRDALERKGIIETVRKKPHFIDPLFKFWFEERFCKTYWLR
ncbi:MAG: hypothetical protein PHT64_01500 [Bacteroidales bacterium]|nr:hypothetical protein [Bacteroidales bacterium]MDD3521557.1 hypothetical protein [Bacteroidales bacterium]MDD4031268.1 hypothetical protein [Bacteroidales bacterium]MDD4435790.1 hypothetical protein [Bacteroidales bacterium]MDD5732456.1 hypothetical protein [Bacteroidales bacterium]